ncbi:beta-keto acid cleavage enzyme [Aureococcus anophagefferens]|nr:beta-keto acid cleavage enzyme [Aureococcus anophagefferens]
MGGDCFYEIAEDPEDGTLTSVGTSTDLVGVDQRLAHIEELKPEICSLDCGSLNFGTGAYVSTLPMLREMAARITAAGVKPELECFEIGHMPMVAQSLLLGGHVRVGLEDNLYLEKGVLATNGELVTKALRLMGDMGAAPATTAEARAILGLRGTQQALVSGSKPPAGGRHLRP